ELLEYLLEELHEAPTDPHLLRILSRLYERDGDLEGARQAVETARSAAGLSNDSAAYDLSGDTTSLRDQLADGRVLLDCRLVSEAEAVVSRVVDTEPSSLAAVN